MKFLLAFLITSTLVLGVKACDAPTMRLHTVTINEGDPTPELSPGLDLRIRFISGDFSEMLHSCDRMGGELVTYRTLVIQCEKVDY